jgi:hypothetical protein
MAIDFNKTQGLCKIVNYAALAREFSITRTAVHLIVTGKYRSMHSPNAQAVLGRLRSMGLVCDVSDDADLAA